MTTTTADDKGRGPVFEDTQGYMMWKGKVNLLVIGWVMDGLSEARIVRKVLGLLSGTPFFIATDGGDINSYVTVDGPGWATLRRTVEQIFAKLEKELRYQPITAYLAVEEFGPVFDGTQDYMEWKLKVALLVMDRMEDGLTEGEIVLEVLHLLSGAPYIIATDGGHIDSCLTVDGPGRLAVRRTVDQIFATLETNIYPRLRTADEALGDLLILYQGHETLEKYTAEFGKLAAIAKIPDTQKPLLFYAGLSSNIKKRFRSGSLPEKSNYPELWKAANQAEKQAAQEERKRASRARRRNNHGGTRQPRRQ